MLEAKRELAHSTQSVKQIAHGMGFADVGYFSRFFRKHAQCSPSEFRLQAQAKRQ
ncbi:helix-turn-helix domain-containing protein [Algiphilus sp. NNCM1]|nr:helix-turn-helix domain-containing protein [Algiphilus acroporae]